EAGNVFLDLQRHLVLVLALLDVWTVNHLHEIVIERSPHRLDRGKKGLHLFQILRIQDARIRRGLVSVVLKNIPAAEGEVRQLGKRDKFLNEWRPCVRTLAQPNRAHLRERSHGLGLAFAYKLHSSHKGGADSAHARKQDPQFPLRGRDFGRLFHAAPFCWTIRMRSTVRLNSKQESPQRKRAASPNKLVMMREDPRICKSQQAKRSRAARSLVRRQEIPDGSVLRPKNPGAESLQAAVFHQGIALAEGARVGEKNPFAHVIAIKEKPRRTVDGILLHVASINPGKIQRVVGGDVLGAWIGL